MRNIKRMSQVEVHLSACELAQVFWAMDSEEQSAFFDELYDIAGVKLYSQLSYIIDDANFSVKAKMAMDAIGEYSKNSSPKVESYGDNYETNNPTMA